MAERLLQPINFNYQSDHNRRQSDNDWNDGPIQEADWRQQGDLTCLIAHLNSLCPAVEEMVAQTALEREIRDNERRMAKLQLEAEEFKKRTSRRAAYLRDPGLQELGHIPAVG